MTLFYNSVYVTFRDFWGPILAETYSISPWEMMQLTFSEVARMLATTQFTYKKQEKPS